MVVFFELAVLREDDSAQLIRNFVEALDLRELGFIILISEVGGGMTHLTFY
jgi:hypothetical protein